LRIDFVAYFGKNRTPNDFLTLKKVLRYSANPSRFDVLLLKTYKVCSKQLTLFNMLLMAYPFVLKFFCGLH